MRDRGRLVGFAMPPDPPALFALTALLGHAEPGDLADIMGQFPAIWLDLGELGRLRLEGVRPLAQIIRRQPESLWWELEARAEGEVSRRPASLPEP